MTEREANIRVNVRGNAAPELAKIDQATRKAGGAARDANGRFLRAGAALDAAGKGAASAAPKVDRLAGANNRLAGSFRKTNAASIAAQTKFKGAANAAGQFADANKRTEAATKAASRSIDQLARSTDRAVGAVRQFSANSRIAPPTPVLSTWQRIAAQVRLAATSARQFAGSVANASVGRGMDGRRLAGGAAALGGFALDTARQAGSTLGIPGRDQLAAQYVDTDVRIARLSAQAHMNDAQTASLRTQVTAAARGGLVSPAEVLSIVETGQNRFSNAQGFATAAPDIARFATATGANSADVTGLVGEAFRQMNVSPDQIGQLLGTLQVTSEKGSIEASDIAGSMSPSIGAFASLTGQTGLGGMQNFLALAQTMGASGGDASVLTQNLLAKLSSGDVQRNLSRRGVEFRGENGQLDMQAMVTSMVGNRRFVSESGQINQTALQGVLGADMQANTAMRTLLQEEIAGRGLNTIASASSAEGSATIDLAMKRIKESAGGGARKAGVNAEANFLENGDALVRNMTTMAASVSNVETRFPRLSMAMDTTRGALGHLTTTLGAMNLAGVTGAGGAGAAGAAGGLRGAAVGLGTAAASIVVATAAWEISTRTTLGLLDSAGAHGLLGERVQREGGSASQDFADFFAGNWNLKGTGIPSWLGGSEDAAHNMTPQERAAAQVRTASRAPAPVVGPTNGGGTPNGGGQAPTVVSDPANTAATDRNSAALEANARATEANTRARRNDTGNTGVSAPEPP